MIVSSVPVFLPAYRANKGNQLVSLRHLALSYYIQRARCWCSVSRIIDLRKFTGRLHLPCYSLDDPAPAGATSTQFKSSWRFSPARWMR